MRNCLFLFFMTTTLFFGGCPSNKYIIGEPDVVLTLKFSDDAKFPTISVDGLIKRGHHKLSKYNSTLVKQKVINNVEYACLSLGGELNNDANFNVTLLEFSISEASKNKKARTCRLNTKVICKIEIEPNDFMSLPPGITIQKHIFEPGDYSFEWSERCQEPNPARKPLDTGKPGDGNRWEPETAT